MKRKVSCLVLATTIGSSLFGLVRGDRTFLAHRDELAYQAIEWTTNNHYRPAKTDGAIGAFLSLTPFYAESTNAQDLAKLFGTSTTGAITVTPANLKTWAEDDALTSPGDYLKTVLNQKLWSFNIDHAPNCDGSTAGQIPMNGVMNLKPKRKAIGAYLGWDQNFDNILKGLRLRIMMPIVNAETCLHPDDSTAIPSSLPLTDGISGATLRDYFSGTLRKGVSTHSHVKQKELVRGKIAGDYINAFGIADIDIKLDLSCFERERFSCRIGASLQLPTGNALINEYLFEPQVGARGHVAAGLNGLLRIHAFNNKDLTVRLDLQADMRYFFEGTEKRFLSIYDKTDGVIMPSSLYRLVMRHKYSGVQPAANVLCADHTVKPGFQLDALAGLSGSWKNWTIDLGYNLYWHQEEKVMLKNDTAWQDDQYAFAHNHYSVYADTTLDRIILGGTSINTDTGVVQHSMLTGTSAYHDKRTAVDKHHNFIGANRDGSDAPVRVSNAGPDDTDSAHKAPGAFTSMGGPIQNWGRQASALRNQTVVTGGDDPEPADATPTDTYTGETTNDTGTQTVRYVVTSIQAVTGAQITHALLGGLSYRLDGHYPVVIGIGGLVELQESNRNSALESSRVWAKLAIQF